MRIKCKIALAVDDRGRYATRGGTGSIMDHDAVNWVLDKFDMKTLRRCYWVEVEVDAPEPSEVQTVKGEAKEAT